MPRLTPPHPLVLAARSGIARLAQALLASLAIVGSTAFAAPLEDPVFIDAGPETTVPRPALTPDDAYDAARGFGWTRSPSAGFRLPDNWSGVRRAALLDGVAGEDYALRLDLKPGKWTILVYLDDGYRDADAVFIALNGSPVVHTRRVFGREEEPETPPINRYRVAQLAVESTGTCTMQFRHAAPGARLLGLHLLPRDWAPGERRRWFERQLSELGRHDNREPLDAIRQELTTAAREATMRGFATYWLAQLDLLDEAEHLHDAGGWDWVSARTDSSMFTRYKIAVSLLDPLVDHPEGTGFLLRERALWRRARLLHWIWLEQHLEEDHEAAVRDIGELRRRHPDDPLIAMYSGEQIDELDQIDGYRAPANAPAWSTAQYEASRRMRGVAHYWIDERQAANGEFGGKFDDDVEALRWWPALLFTGDRKALDSFARLSEGIWFSRGMHLGYSRVARDVEHSAEFVADTAPMMALLTREERLINRLVWSRDHMSNLWTGLNDAGHRQFRSAWIGATEVLMDPPRNRDLSMSARATKAVRYLAWLRDDPVADTLLHEWSLTWAHAAARTDKGKPRGLFPASLRWPDAAFNGDEPTWHRANMFWRYFDWTADGRLYDQLLFSWVRTRDPLLLEPMEATLALLEAWADPELRGREPEGSPGWAAHLLHQNAEFWGVVAQWRLETGNSRFDRLLREQGPPYLQYRMSGDAQVLAEGISRSLLDVLRCNTPMRTTEVLFTDRIRVSRDVGNWSGTDLLVAMITGNHVPDSMSPYYHVAWENAPESFTALVTRTGTDTFCAELYLHQTASAQVCARLLRLSPGAYTWRLSSSGRDLAQGTAQVAGPEHRITLEVPGASPVVFEIARTPTS